MSSHGMQAALEADRRRTPPTELTDSLATIQDTKAGPLTFEARDALRRRIQRLYGDREQLLQLQLAAARTADVLGSLLHDLEDPGTEALAAHYELNRLLAQLPGVEHDRAAAFPSAQALHERSWHAALRAVLRSFDDNSSPGDDPGDFYAGLVEDLLYGPGPPLGTDD